MYPTYVTTQTYSVFDQPMTPMKYSVIDLSSDRDTCILCMMIKNRIPPCFHLIFKEDNDLSELI